MPSETFQHSGFTATDLSVVWAALDKPATWETVPGVDRVYDPVIDESGRLQGFMFESVAIGKTFIGRATPAARVERATMAWDILTTELKGLTTVEIQSSGEGTQVAVRLDVKSVGVLASIFFPVIVSNIGDGFSSTVESFVAALG
ncbi:MAG: hypothetical protein WBZ40_02775 [Acidimicrobiia bacterium]